MWIQNYTVDVVGSLVVDVVGEAVVVSVVLSEVVGCC